LTPGSGSNKIPVGKAVNYVFLYGPLQSISCFNLPFFVAVKSTGVGAGKWKKNADGVTYDTAYNWSWLQNFFTGLGAGWNYGVYSNAADWRNIFGTSTFFCLLFVPFRRLSGPEKYGPKVPGVDPAITCGKGNGCFLIYDDAGSQGDGFKNYYPALV
jgi:hypothetical protein